MKKEDGLATTRGLPPGTRRSILSGTTRVPVIWKFSQLLFRGTVSEKADAIRAETLSNFRVEDGSSGSVITLSPNPGHTATEA